MLEFKKKREYQRQKYLEEKHIQRLIANSEEIRPFLRKKLLEESKRTQLIQIEDKAKQREMNNLNEKMWFEVQQKSIQQKVNPP